MITATIREAKKVRGIATEKKSIVCYHSIDKARSELRPIAKDMAVCRKTGKQPSREVVAVSYDTKSEKSLLLELKVITSIENEEE